MSEELAAGREPRSGSSVEIQVNGKGREVRRGITVLELLEELEVHPGLVVVERNREILDRERYAEVEVTEGDRIELVHFVGGG